MTGAGATQRAFVLATASVALAVAGCAGSPATSIPQLANPASDNCAAQGGRVVIETAASGQYGVCLFEDNRSARSGRCCAAPARSAASGSRAT